MTKSIDISSENLPKHIALIMDGNGRWAKERGLNRISGHKKGLEALIETVQAAKQLEIPYITLYAFSTENTNRPESEIRALIELLQTYLPKYVHKLHEHQVRLRMIGRYREWSPHLAPMIQKVVDSTMEHSKFNLTVGLNYSSRTEFMDAVQRYCLLNSNTEKVPDWEMFSKYLDTEGLPDPDLIIRTSGEQRMSNFLMMQGAYSELYFTKTYWPDFGKKELCRAIMDYQSRQRRFGKTSE